VHEVFVSYRKVDLRLFASAVRLFLAGRLGADKVFMDHKSMEPGEIYPPALREALDRARVLLVLIGPGWPGIPRPANAWSTRRATGSGGRSATRSTRA
jgi:hypothetical protein